MRKPILSLRLRAFRVMMSYPACSALPVIDIAGIHDRHHPESAIGITGLGDRHPPESPIVFTGLRRGLKGMLGAKFTTSRNIYNPFGFYH